MVFNLIFLKKILLRLSLATFTTVLLPIAAFAQPYGTGPYGGCKYQNCASGSLSTTGDTILLVSSIAAIVLAISIAIILYLRRKKRRSVEQNDADDSQQ